MKTRFSLQNKSRKELAKSLATLFDTNAHYLGTPSMRYEIGGSVLEKDGTVTWASGFSKDDIEGFISELEDRGFKLRKDEFIISLPADRFSEEVMLKLERILNSKGDLIKKALKADRITAEKSITTVDFPWFDRLLEADEARVYTEFVSRLCRMAIEQTRVLERETVTDNEKYSFRCFLLRLGYIGTEHKAARKMLLRHLNGSSAYRYGKVEE